MSDEVIIAALGGELTRERTQLERQVDVCSTNGPGVRGTGRAQDITCASKNKSLERQLILTSASVSLLILKSVISFPTLILRFRFSYCRHHHVESVHLTATGGRPLHPALAVVQTPAREYYILRDNGCEVGCEEDGVASVWMRILGCDARGEPIGRAAVSFEELKAYIQNL